MIIQYLRTYTQKHICAYVCEVSFRPFVAYEMCLAAYRRFSKGLWLRA